MKIGYQHIVRMLRVGHCSRVRLSFSSFEGRKCDFQRC